MPDIFARKHRFAHIHAVAAFVVGLLLVSVAPPAVAQRAIEGTTAPPTVPLPPRGLHHRAGVR